MKDTVEAKWVTSTIGEICDLVNGKAFKPKDWTDEGLPIVRIQNLNKPDAPFNRFSGEVPEKFLIDSGQLLFAWSGTPGTSFGAHIWNGGPAVLNQHIFKVEFDEHEIDKHFLSHAINQTLEELIGKAHGGVGLRHVTKGVFEATEIGIPPLPEQRRIVAKLDRLSTRSAAARDHLARTTKLATRVKQAILASAFEGRLTEAWRITSGAQFPWAQPGIGEVAQIVTGNTPPTKNKANYGDDYPFVKPGDLDKGVISATANHLSSEGYSIARQLPVDTVLVSCIGNLGKIGILAREGSCNQQINALLPSADLLPRFTYWWAHTIRQWLEENSSATTVSIINKGRFSLAPISVPSAEEQSEIVRRIEAAFARIDRLTEEATRACHLLDRLDERLLAKAFRGELVPQGPEDEPAEALLTRIREARATAPKAKRGRRKAS